MTKSDKNSLGEKVRNLRLKQGLSQGKLARLADVSNNTIVNLENGTNKNPTVETLKKIATALEISVDKLF